MASATFTVLAVCGLALRTPSFLAGEEPMPVATTDVSAVAIDSDGESTSAESEVKDQIPKETCDIVLAVLAEFNKMYQTRGDSESIAEWQQYAKQLATHCGTDDVVNVARKSLQMIAKLREHNELLDAQHLMPHLLKLAEVLKEERPQLYINALYLAAMLESDFERYESSLAMMSKTLELLEKQDEVKTIVSITYRANFALFLRKTGKVDEAEELYLELIKEAEEHPDDITKTDVGRLRVGLARLYSDRRDFQKAVEIMKQGGEYRDESGKVINEIGHSCGIMFIQYKCANGELDEAAETAELVLVASRTFFGKSSRAHLEALEMYAEVRLLQSRHREALELLKTQAVIRARLFGADHPSVAALKERFKRICDQARDNDQTEWKRLFVTEDETDDRYDDAITAESPQEEVRK